MGTMADRKDHLIEDGRDESCREEVQKRSRRDPEEVQKRRAGSLSYRRGSQRVLKAHSVLKHA